MELSKKSMGISPSPTLSIDAKYKEMLAQGEDIVGFGAGEPDFDTPEHIKDAAIAAIKNGQTKYTPAAGTMALRKAICAKFKRDNGLDYEPTQIVVSNGAKHSLVNVFQAILNVDDEVIIPKPFWVSYPEMVKIADGIPVYIDTKEEDDFKFTVEELKSAITPKTKALILNSPSNPTGMLYNEDELREIAKVCLEHNIFIVADEIYEKLIYDGEKHVSVASLGDDIKNITIIVNGVSKTFAMTGWRIGYTASTKEIAKIMSNVQSHATSNPSSISQAAAIAALEGPEDSVVMMRNEFDKRRKFMVENINKIDNLSCSMPKGAFYVMMNIKKLFGKEINGVVINSSDVFCELALKDAKVALVPGSGFGADGYVRWSYATSMENIKKGIERIEKLVAGK